MMVDRPLRRRFKPRMARMSRMEKAEIYYVFQIESASSAVETFSPLVIVIYLGFGCWDLEFLFSALR
jgi:hypothetical protein